MATQPPDAPDDVPDPAFALQDGLAGRVESRDRFHAPLRTVAGFAFAFEDAGATTRAVAVVVDVATSRVVQRQSARVANAQASVPGFMSFHVLPALLQAFALLDTAPDLAFITGHGIAHPRGLGTAAHFGVETGLATVGVAEEILTGTGPEPHQVRGAYTALRHGRRQIGWLLRSKPGLPPLVVSPGHRVAMASAADLVMRFVVDDRLPEPIRLASVAPA